MKPLLVGMWATDLWPDPLESVGWRLWQLSGMERETWLEGFDRVNLIGGGDLDREIAAARARKVLRMTPDRHVLILGHEVRRALGFPRRPWLESWEGREGQIWRLLPYPSARCQAYNDPAFRAVVGIMLRELANG